MGVLCSGCMITAADVDGEYICVRCGRVYGYVEVAGTEEIRSHHITSVVNGSGRLGRTAKQLVINLNLPEFALHTIMRVASKLTKSKVKQKHALLFATLYACREHNIPRLLEDILRAMREVYGTEIAKSEVSLIKLLNKTIDEAFDLGYSLKSPDKYYYLKAYLAKIQTMIITETGSEYYEYLKARAYRAIVKYDRHDPSYSARSAILFSTSRALQDKIERVLSVGELNV